MKSLDDYDLPGDKLYYSIGEVAQVLEVEPHTLRYWEDEFEQLEPEQTPGGQRRYGREDLECLVKIIYLVRDQKFTTEGARQKLRRWEKYSGAPEARRQIKTLCDEALSDINSFVENNL